MNWLVQWVENLLFRPGYFSELQYWQRLMTRGCPPDEILWVDERPVVTLANGQRWKLDLCVWIRGPGGTVRADFVAVGRKQTHAFKARKLMFERRHPSAPLMVVTWNGCQRTQRRGDLTAREYVKEE